MLNLTDREKKLVLAGFISGYQFGHEDTVDAGYCDPTDRAKDFLSDAIDDGGLEYVIEQIGEI